MLQLKLFVSFLLIVACISLGYSQGGVGKLKDEADVFFKNKNYSSAITLYQRYLTNGGSVSATKNLGIALFETNRLSEAEVAFYKYYSANPKDVEVVYYLGQTFQQHLNFDKAIEFYKYYLALTKSSNDNYEKVIENIKRCGNAKKIKYQEELAICENAGSNVNTAYDEFNPVWSPNYYGRVYFTSNQPIDTSNGTLTKDEVGHFNMFGSEVEINSGLLGRGFPVNFELITSQNEELYGFSEDGKVLYFGRGNGLDALSIFTENTNLPSGDPKRVHELVTPFQGERGIIDVFPFTNEILLFSSDRPGGFGGYDLYYSELKNGMWSEPINLGEQINTQYDERSPFLSTDGRTLYFSSNNMSGIGGFDIFKTFYEDKTMSWETPTNIGMPINSPGDDLFFKLGNDGQKAVFCSNRKSGSGGFDLYTGLFKEVRKEQHLRANPQAFFQVPALRMNTKEYQDEVLASKIYSVTIEPFYYTTNENIVQSKNKQQLDQLVGLMKKFPTSNIEVMVNCDANVSPEIELYFGIKRGEIFRDYLVSKGISTSRITVQSVGSLYPIAKNMIDGKVSVSGQNLNRRIDVVVSNIDSLPVKVTYKKPFVSDLLKTNDGAMLKGMTEGLCYRVQFITLKQMYSGDIMSLNSDLMIETQDEISGYRYMAGMFKNYTEAKEFKETLVNHGLTDAFIVPYINNIRYSKSFLSESIINRYPDLRKYYLDL